MSKRKGYEKIARAIKKSGEAGIRGMNSVKFHTEGIKQVKNILKEEEKRTTKPSKKATK